MDEKRRRFADLLGQAVRAIKARDGKPISVIQDELGYHVNPPENGKIQEKGAGTTIEYWRKGNLPPSHAKIERLARELARRGHMEQSWLTDFLEAADFGTGSEELIEELFPSATPKTTVPAATHAPFQAPALTPHFAGRTAEFSQLETLLTTPATPRIIALVGMGGIGKTTLAVKLAHKLRNHFRDGVLWARLATADPYDSLQSWAQAYGYDFRGLSDVENRASAMRNLLSQKQCLLVLDDLRNASAAQYLLPNSAACTLLLTTRNHEVATALNATTIQLDELDTDAAVSLLCRLLGNSRVQPEIVAAQHIATILHFLPLALEIAAQRLAARPQQQLAHFAQQLQVATTRLSQLTVSDRAVRTAFGVSWEHLEPELQQLFALLGIFSGRSFSIAALAFIAAQKWDNVQEQIWSLQALSLVSAEGVQRYRQHPLLADFAREQLKEEDAVTLRLVDYFLRFAREHQTNSHLLEPEWENLMAAMEGAYHQQAWQRLLDYAEVLTEPWFRFAHYTKARQGYAWAIEAARRMDHSQLLPSFLRSWGEACLEQNDYEEAAQHLQESLRLSEQSRNTGETAHTLRLLAKLARQQIDYGAAEQWLRRSHQLCQQVGDRHGLADTVYQQAQLAYQQGDYSFGEQLREVSVMQAQNGDQVGRLKSLRLLALWALAQQQESVAEEYGLQALELSRKLDNKGELASTLYTLTAIFRCQSKLPEAKEYALASAQQFEKMGDRRSCALSLYELSIIDERQEEYPEALQSAQKSLQILQSLQDAYVLVFVQMHLGDLMLRVGQVEQARHYWAEAYQGAVAQDHTLCSELAQRLAKGVG